MPVENVVAAEVAEQEFTRFLQAMDLEEAILEKLAAAGPKEAPKDSEPDPFAKGEAEDGDDGDEPLLAWREKVIKAMMRGSLVIDDQGRPVFTPSAGIREPITFNEPTGKTLMAMSQAKNRGMAGVILGLADMTGRAPTTFSNMRNRDLSVVLAVFNIFLAGQ
jgi:hypothetical protein